MENKQIRNLNLFNGGNMEYMKNIPDKYFDLAIVDPPYFKGVANGSFFGGRVSKNGVKRLCSKSDFWNDNIPNQKYYEELIRVSENQIIWGINYFDFVGVPHGRIIWDKINDTSTFSNCEIASNSLCNGVFIYRELWNGMIKSEKCQRIHPTQKPINLYAWLLKKYAKQGDKILDTHLGSGISAIAAYNVNMDLKFDGIEIDKEYFDKSIKRIEELTREQSLF